MDLIDTMLWSRQLLRQMRRPGLMLVTFAVLTQLGGCALFYRYGPISEQPTREPANAPLEVRASTLQPDLSMPLAALQGAANAAASTVLPFEQDGSQRLAEIRIEKPWPFYGCLICESLDAQWHYKVDQPSPIVVAGDPNLNRVVVNLPAAINGGAGFNGEIAKWLSLNNKSFGAAVEVRFASGLAADRNFCPSLSGLDLDYRWITDPYIQLIGRSCVLGNNFCFGPANLEFAGDVDRQIRPQLQTIASTLQHNIPCAPVRDSLSKAWKPYSFPVKVPYEELFLNIMPQALFFPGLQVNSTDITFVGRLDAKVSLDPSPLPSTSIPLPENKPAPISPGRFSLAVPISTQYYTFGALAKQALDQQKFISETSVGRVRVLPRKVDLYPTAGGQQLALGVAVAVEFEYLFFLNTSGTVWLTAKPEAVGGGRKVRLSEIKVTRKFTNPIWKIASVLIEDRLTQAIKDGFEVDLNQPFSTAEADITKLINNAGQGEVKLTASDVKIGLGRMLANDRAFQVEALFDAKVDASLGQIAIP